MNELIEVAVFATACVLTPITILLMSYVLVNMCNKLQPTLTKILGK